jgi:hypothetical protein
MFVQLLFEKKVSVSEFVDIENFTNLYPKSQIYMLKCQNFLHLAMNFLQIARHGIDKAKPIRR